MVQDTNRSDPTINRRRILQGLSSAGVIGVAGCFGDGDGDGDGEDGDGDGDGEDGDGDGDGGQSDIQFPLEVQLEVNGGNDDRVQMVELFAESLEQTGYFETTIETYEWNQYVGRVLDPEYAENGFVPCIGLSGTFNPHSFCDALHHSSNQGQCCNLNGIAFDHLDEMLDNARFGADVAEDPELRAERYDEIWRELTELAASSITHFDLETAVTNTDVIGWDAWPFNESVLSYPLYTPTEEQVAWIDRDGGDPENDDLSNLQEGGTLRAGLSANVDSFDAPYSTDTTSSMAQNFLYEGLTTTDKSGNIYPWLAESYELLDTNDVEAVDYGDYMRTVEAGEEGALDVEEQILIRHPEDFPAEEGDEVRILTVAEAGDAVEDGTFGMQYRYELHEGIEFHNGDELTAEDVLASYRRYENSDTAAQTFDSVLHVEQIDEYTVDVYAQVIDAEAERELPGVTIIPAEHADLEPGGIDPRQGTTPVGTGPYVFEEFEDAQYYRVTKNDDYWVEQMGIDQKDWFDGSSDFPDGPVIEEVDMDIIDDDATRSGALQNDEIDMTYGLTADTLDDFDASDEFHVTSTEAGGYEYFQYPVNVEPWDDERVRQAVNHLVPRESIVQNVLAGWARPAWTPVPELAQGAGTTDPEALEEELRPMNEYNPERAQELLEDAIEDNGWESDV